MTLSNRVSTTIACNKNTWPRLIVIAGPSGIGKSTLIQQLIASKAIIEPCISADNIPLSHIQTASQKEASVMRYQMNDSIRNSLIIQRISFLTETTLADTSGRRLQMLRFAKEMGYYVALIFLYTKIPSIVLTRRRKRGALHDKFVTYDKVLAQQEQAFVNFQLIEDAVDSSILLEIDLKDFDSIECKAALPEVD